MYYLILCKGQILFQWYINFNYDSHVQYHQNNIIKTENDDENIFKKIAALVQYESVATGRVNDDDSGSSNRGAIKRAESSWHSPGQSRRTTATDSCSDENSLPPGSAVNNFQPAPGTDIADNLFGGQFSRRTG